MGKAKARIIVVFEGVNVLRFVDTIEEKFFEKAEKDIEDSKEDSNDSNRITSNEFVEVWRGRFHEILDCLEVEIVNWIEQNSGVNYAHNRNDIINPDFLDFIED